MRRSELAPGVEVAVFRYHVDTRTRRALSPHDVERATVIEVGAPYPRIDDDPAQHGNLTTVRSVRYLSEASKSDPDPKNRATGILVELADDARRRRVWVGSTRWFAGTWAVVSASWAARSRTAHPIGSMVAGTEMCWSPDAIASISRQVGFSPGETLRRVVVVDFDADASNHSGLEQVDGQPLDGQRVAVVEWGGRLVVIANRHHLFRDPDEVIRRRRVERDRDAARKNASVAARRIADILELGRWAPNGNRYHDDARFADVASDDLPADSAGLTCRGHSDVLGIGVEALLRIVTADEDQRDRITALLEQAVAGLLDSDDVVM